MKLSFRNSKFLVFAAFFALWSALSIAEEKSKDIAEEPKEVYVIGHLNPDADSIGGAIAAGLLFDAIPARTGEINQETNFLLKYFKMKAPIMLKDFLGKNIIAVDFNQKSQAPKGIEDARIIRIIDHHALQSSPLTSDVPIDVEIRPWGSASTIIAKMFFDKKHMLPLPVAGMLLGAIISDTLNLRSETTTDHDREMVKTLAKMVKITDVDTFARQMFLAKSDVSKKTDDEIIKADYKLFDIGQKKIAIGVAETLLPKQILDRKDGLLTAAKKQKEADSADLLFFFIIDTDKIKSTLLVIGDEEKKAAEAAFGGKAVEDFLDTKDRVSRKLQFVPALTKYLEKK